MITFFLVTYSHVTFSTQVLLRSKVYFTYVFLLLEPMYLTAPSIV